MPTANFTVEKIQQAHSKVRSGADFPRYIQDLKQLGVKGYETFVHDGHTSYTGNGHEATTPAKYDALTVADTSDAGSFTNRLKAHQQGQTDYPTFCSDCAATGVEKWVVDINAMTCTYYDKQGNTLLQEQIPG